MSIKRILTAIAASISLSVGAADFDYRADVIANASTGDLAPYLLSANNGGKFTNAKGIWQNGLLQKSMLDKHFDWGFGFEYLIGFGSDMDYDRWNPENKSWTTKSVNSSPIQIQQLWAEARYRGLYLCAGMHSQPSLIVDANLSSGDITRSNNARPIPGLEIGFNDFQNIPFTNGWLQIEGRIMYGKMTDSSFKNKMFNHYNGLIGTDLWYTYKRCYFRTNPTQPLSVIVGMQTGGLFAGKTEFYRLGNLYRTENRGFHMRDLWDMFFPSEGDEDYYKGSSLGSWDFKASYNLRNGSKITAYFEWPWEDGSGIGRRNGWDGLWGVQYDCAKAGWVSKVLFEYIDFTNQCGWLHFSHNDYPGTSIGGHADGADNYYNNSYYGPYANYGLAIGSPFIIAPAYNSDGRYEYLHNRTRGFHAAIAGNPNNEWSYSAKLSWQQAGGNGAMAAKKRYSSTSALLAVNWNPECFEGVSFSAKAAFDAGKLRGNNVGVMLGITYSGNFAYANKKFAK